MATKKPSRGRKKNARPASSIVWFEVPADDLGRAKQFYRRLFGWTFQKLPAAVNEYWHIDTGGKDDSPDRGMVPRMHLNQSITNYISVSLVDWAAAKWRSSGTVCKSKITVPGMGTSQFAKIRRAIPSSCGK